MRLPEVEDGPELPVRKMTLREYAHFSELCLRSHPSITAENCMEKRASEKEIRRPFSLKR